MIVLNKDLCCAALLCFLGLPTVAQAQVPQASKSFFDDRAPIPVGAYYYPEHWPRAQWARDLRRMAALGFSFTHMGEFAWANMEPEDGRFDFEWLDTALAEAGKAGLKVVLCTPTATPPAWLTEKHPEILLVGQDGIRQQHGSRLHVNVNHPIYLTYVKRIVEQLGKRYGQDPRVWGWQLDNEPHLGTNNDYSPSSQQEFQTWLQKRYGNIGALNHAWGAAFWSQTYKHFEEVKAPNPKANLQGGNPHAQVDFQRFTADKVATALRFQSRELRQLVRPEQFITTNYSYMDFQPVVDLFRNRNDLDFASYTMYLTSTYLNYPKGALAARLGSGMALAFAAEFVKSVNGVTGIMELQPGQINWGQYNAQPLPGAVRMWMWHSYALGNKFIGTYLYRQPRFGGEMYHKGIMETDGVTVSPGGEEFVKTMKEFAKLPHDANTPVPRSVASRRTGFMWKNDNLYDLNAGPHTQHWKPWQHFYTYYENLKTIGAQVTFLQEDDAFDPARFPFMVAPSYVQVDATLIQKWERYVRSGGHLILTPRTGLKDGNGHLWEALQQEPIWPLIGARIKFNDHLPPERTAKVKMNGKVHNWSVWGEVLEVIPQAGPDEPARVLATYADQFFVGKPAATTRKLGKGSVTYVGVWTTDGELERAVLRMVYGKAGAEILDLPRYVFSEWRDGNWIAVNYTSKDVQAPLQAGSDILVGSRTMKPGGVTVWKTRP